MSNKRKEIRHAFKDLLKNRTRAMDSVFTSRSRAVLEEELPAINVWAADETPEVAGEAPFRYKRTLEVTVELYLNSVYDADDDMDDFLSEVENIVDGQDLFTLSKSVDKVYLTESHIEPRGETAKECVVASLKYAVEYYTYAGVDSSFLPPLEGIKAKWDEDGFTQDHIDFPTP